MGFVQWNTLAAEYEFGHLVFNVYDLIPQIELAHPSHLLIFVVLETAGCFVL